MNIQVFSFAKVTDSEARKRVYKQIKEGHSRFGMWDQRESLRDEYYGKNSFLLRIRKGDWIVHINCPEYGECVAVRANGEYDFDEGFECSWGRDFRNYIPVDPATILEFDRNNPNVLTSVNLSPMRRGQRILQVEDFLQSLENIRENKYLTNDGELRGVVHLKEKINQDFLPKITQYIHEMNRSKNFENFLHEIFDSMPHTVSLRNGFGWGTDFGADLIVEFQNPIIGVNLTSKLIVQAKSYEGDHVDLKAVDQIVEGIQKYKADGGLLITTGNSTEELEDYVQKKSEEIGKAIDVIAGSNVARFVIRYAPEMLVGMKT